MAKEIEGVKLYNENEMAEMLGVNKQTVQRYRLRGKLQAVQIGKSWYISQDNLKRFLEGRERVEKQEGGIS